ncbi:diguanylate cyclase/phosphodiesterase (GGDEF & EAL domains) with PAS/PAC sensor(s) [plant metagenome]|uniref:Diguanylate cyclase/phosphodiesterase (GGDEF & EAL domains) with PAS/PAC sensor(S) n=1 Tax=plant metagenome TaxID=1297885 RepID=A0A484V5H4_9ZZZZ
MGQATWGRAAAQGQGRSFFSSGIRDAEMASMNNESRVFSLPKWRLTKWLSDAGPDVPPDIRVALIGGLFGTLPIFFGGVVNTILVALIVTLRQPEPAFFFWLGLEVLVCMTRLVLLIVARRNALVGKSTYTDMTLLLAVIWAMSVGYGAFICLLSGDWVAACIACLSAAAMVGGICFRNFGAPRMTGIMIAFTLGPCCVAAFFTNEPVLGIVLAQIPAYLVSMTIASYRLNKMLVSTMRAERESEQRAQQDPLTGLANRTGLFKMLDRALRQAQESHARFAVFYLDLDGFKAVNDTYGHGTGDSLLKAVADRLALMKPGSGVAARMGGDEFVVLACIERGFDPGAFAECIVEAVCQPYELAGGITVQVGGSVGLALVPEHGTETASVLVAADRALYRAKTAGKSCWVMAETQESGPVGVGAASAESRLPEASAAR